MFFGQITEVEEPTSLGRTFAWEGMSGEPSVERLELEELDGERTRLVTVSTFESQADRDAMLAGGMEQGVNESYERLDELAARQRTG